MDPVNFIKILRIKTFYTNGYYTIFQYCLLWCDLMMYKLNNTGIFLHSPQLLLNFKKFSKPPLL